MTWHTDVVSAEALERLLDSIRRTAGTVVSCKRLPGRVEVTWTAPG